MYSSKMKNHSELISIWWCHPGIKYSILCFAGNEWCAITFGDSLAVIVQNSGLQHKNWKNIVSSLLYDEFITALNIVCFTFLKMNDVLSRLHIQWFTFSKMAINWIYWIHHSSTTGHHQYQSQLKEQNLHNTKKIARTTMYQTL